MIFMLVYIFGIILYMFLKDDTAAQKKFGHLALCMWTLVMDGTLMDSPGTTATELLHRGTFASVFSVGVFLCFILISALTVMNMLIGVLCEVVSAVGAHEREDAAIRLLKQSILVELLKFDEDGNSMISEDEFNNVMQDDSAVRSLRHLGVDVQYLRDYQQMLYQYQPEYSIEAIMQLCLVCRGDLPVQVQHLVDAQAFTRWFVSENIRASEERIRTLCDSKLERTMQAKIDQSLQAVVAATAQAVQGSTFQAV